MNGTGTFFATLNTVKVTPEMAQAIYDLDPSRWDDAVEITQNSEHFAFNPHHGEGADYLASSAVQGILKAHKVRGVIVMELFDEKGTAQKVWGYAFDGKGGIAAMGNEMSMTARREHMAKQKFGDMYKGQFALNYL